MASRHQITCIKKMELYNPNERITHIGGLNPNNKKWQLTQEEAIKGIEDGKWEFYVRAGGHTVEVIVAVSRFGNKYLKTESDGDSPDNLLSLPQCF